MAQNLSSGYIEVNVLSGNGAYPIDDATVIIKEGGKEEAFKVLYSNRDGETGRVEVSAPALILSEAPSNLIPYSVYDVYVSKKEYYTNIYKGLQVFSNTVSIQNAYMIPLPKGDNITSKEKVFVITPHNLSAQGVDSIE